MFFIIVDRLSPAKGDVGTSPAGWSCCDSAVAEDPVGEP